MNIEDIRQRAVQSAPGLILISTAIGLAACGAQSEQSSPMPIPTVPIHVVCKSGDGKVMLDDYAVEDTIMSYTTLSYTSKTTGRKIRVFDAACVAVEEPQTAGWTPVIPGRS